MSSNDFTPGRNFFNVEAFLEDRGGSIKLPLVSSGPEKVLFPGGSTLSGAKVGEVARADVSEIPSGIRVESDEILKYTMRGGKTQIISRVIVSDRIVNPNLPHFRPKDWAVQQDVGNKTSPKIIFFLANLVQGSKHLYEYSFESGGWKSVKEMDVYDIDDAQWVVGFKRNMGVRMWTARYAKGQVEND